MCIKQGSVCVLLLLLLTGCGQPGDGGKENISDAYERQEAISILETDTAGEGTEETSSISQTSGNTEETTPADWGPPRYLTSEAAVVGADDEVEYQGIRFHIEGIAKSNHVDVLYELMDKEDADAFKRQILSEEYSKSFIENGGYTLAAGRPEYQSEFVAIKFTMTNTTDEDRIIDMTSMPLYNVDSNLDIAEFCSGGDIDASLLQHDGAVMDFYGEHYKNVNPHVGIETSNSNQNHMLKAGETFETVVLMNVCIMFYGPDRNWYFCTAFLGGRPDPLNIPNGAQLIPIEFE